jgi:uncharacterized glyoxalase superfamily protein PhnB
VIPNRSIPQSSVIPELAYPDVGEAARWLVEAFGFSVRLRIANHRVQMNVGEGAIVVVEAPEKRDPSIDSRGAKADQWHSVMVRVGDVDAHHARAKHCGANIVRPPTDYPFGERQYTVADFAGHTWTFTQSIADVDPASWGGVGD